VGRLSAAHAVRARAQPERGEASDVDGGKQVEVGVDLVLSADPGSPSAVLAARQMAELAFDFRPGRAVVGLPVRFPLFGACVAQPLLMTADADCASRCCSSALRGQRAGDAPIAEVGDASPSRPRQIGTVALAGQVTVSAPRSITKRSLVNSPPAAVGGWVLQPEAMFAPASRSRKARCGKPRAPWPGPVGRCAPAHHRPVCQPAR